MLKKTITYTNFNDEEVSEDYFFHLSKAELVELEMSHRGGLSEAIQRIIAAEDNQKLIAEFKNIILHAYGKRSEDGRQFIKNEELREEFVSTEAYSALFMELITDTDTAVEFVQGIIPKGIEEEAERIVRKQELKAVKEPEEQAEETKEPDVINKAAVATMSAEELKDLGVRLQSGEAVLGE